MSTYLPGSRVTVTGTYMCLGCATQVELARSATFRSCGKGCLFPRYVLLAAMETVDLDLPPDRQGPGRGNPRRL